MRLGAALLTATLVSASADLAKAVSPAEVALPAAVICATSTGYWEESPADILIEHAPGAATEPAKAAEPRHGYYKLFAVRQPDRTSKVYLQQIAQTGSGPEVVSSVELDEFTQLKPYITDIRPETSTGIIEQPGLFATVYLKTDPDGDSETWTVLIDEFGEIKVERPTN